MARMIKSITKVNQYVKLTTVFDDHEADHSFKVDDVLQDLRFVADGEIQLVSGRVAAIQYKMKNPLSWNPVKPSDTLSEDVQLTNVILDTSEKYQASQTIVPLMEIVEYEDEKDFNVVQMKVSPFIVVDMELHYSNYKVQTASMEVGDVFNNVKIMNPLKPGIENDITGKFEVIGFAYTNKSGVLNVNGVALKNVETGEKIVIEFKYILELNEVFNYEVTDNESLAEVLSNIADGDSIIINNEIDTTGKPITSTQKDITLTMNENLVSGGDINSGIHVRNSGKLTIDGTGTVTNNTPYDATHNKCTISVREEGELTINNCDLYAVIKDDPVNKGQFGIGVYDDAKLTVNNGNFVTGWYCVSGNGTSKSPESIVEINGGTFTSITDYAIYHPQAGKLVINGGTFAGAAGAIAVNNGEVLITGGKFTVRGGGDTGNWSDGTSGLDNVAINLNAKYGDVKCVITGGEFHATAAGTILISTGTAHTVDLKIMGGKFTSKPNDEWIAEGYMVSGEPIDGFYVVTPKLL